MEFIPFSSKAAKEWDDVVHHSPDGWVFSLACWIEMVNPSWEMENRSFAVRENGKLLAVMPLHWVPSAKRIASGGWATGGPCVLAAVSAEDRRRLWRTCLAHAQELAGQVGAEKITMAISPLSSSSLHNLWGVNPLVTFGFTDISTHTRIVDLRQAESELWLDLAQDARQKIKRSKTAGYTVRCCPWREMVDVYYRIHTETYLRTGVKPHPKAYFDGIAAVPDKHAVLWVGFSPQGSPVAFHNEARFRNGSLYHTGCSQTAHLKSGINYLLFWEAMLGAKADGCEWYETGETFPEARGGKEKGLSDFKKKFGGELHRFFKGEMTFKDLSPRTDDACPANPVAPGRQRPFQDWLGASYQLGTYVFGRRIAKGLAWMGRVLWFPFGNRR